MNYGVFTFSNDFKKDKYGWSITVITSLNLDFIHKSSCVITY